MFIYIGYMFSKSGIADDLYQMLYVWMGPVRGGLAIGTVVLMSIIAAINGLSVAGMAVGNTICLPGDEEARVRQDHDLGGHPGRQLPGHHDPAQRGPGAVRHDRPAAGRPALDGRRVSRPHAGDPVHPLHPHPLPGSSPSWGRRRPRKSGTFPGGRSSSCSAPRSFPSSSSS